MCSFKSRQIFFNTAVQTNIPKPLYIKFVVNTLRYCGEMACVEENLHTFGNSDITIYRFDLCAKLLALLLNGATCFTGGEEGSIVTHNGSIIPGKQKTKAQ